MELELKQKVFFTRIVCTIAAVSLFLLAIVRSSEEGGFVLINVLAASLCTVTAVLASLFPFSRAIPQIIPAGMLIIYITGNIGAYTSAQPLPALGLMVFPMYAFFLGGLRGGLIYTAVLGGWALSVLAVNNFSSNVFAVSSSADFPVVFAIAVMICLMQERFLSILHRRMYKHTYFDSLTGIRNRAGFVQILEAELTGNSPFFLVMTDFDHFSRINTNLGGRLCDEIICRMGHVLRDSRAECAARWVGDQFMLIFRGSRETVERELKSIAETVEKIPSELELDVLLTFCAGISEFPADSRDMEIILTNVECALTEAKKANRRGVHFFNPEDYRLRRREIQIEQEILSAAASGQIQVHFQPKISVKDRKVVGMEGLLRWVHPELGYIPPPEFVSAAERTGAIEALGEFVFEHSFAHLQECHRAGLADISISVNVSPIHLLHQNFLAKLLSRTEKWRIDPKFVILEITENVIIQDDVRELLQAIQENDFLLSLDDFGTGYSSLSYLSRFRFDELKIDKSFTDTVMTGGRDLALFKSILELSSHFGMKTVVEGVETEDQRALVEKLCADEIQGWFYSKALPSENFIAYALSVNNSHIQ